MKPWGTPRPWPPDEGDELRNLFSAVHSRRVWPDAVDPHPNLKVAMDELDAWLNDARPYDPDLHKWPWRSMIRDVKAAIDTRGPFLKNATPAVDDLCDELMTPSIGGNNSARAQARTWNAQARVELRTPTAAVAAFDDLVAALRSPATSLTVVDARVAVLDATLRTADRGLSGEANTLAGVADNSAWAIALARHDLDGTPLPDTRRDLAEDAGLSLDERIELCRRLIAQPTRPGRHVIWVAYERARFAASSWRFEFGPVTFFEGPALLGAIDHVAEIGDGRLHRDIPPELLAEDELGKIPRSYLCPTHDEGQEDIKDWVNVRIDLGNGAYADPASVGRDQAAALVKLAAFHNGGTSWKPLSGYLHVVDGALRAISGSFSRPIEHRWADYDYTDQQLEDLHPHLGDRLPVDDPELHELIDAAGALDASSDSRDPTSLLLDVRVIEALATRCGSRWKHHLQQNFAVRWAHNEILGEITQAVADAVGDSDLIRSGNLPDLEGLRLRITTPRRYGRGHRWRGNPDVALNAIPELLEQLPPHHLATRRIRTVAERSNSLASVQGWVDELVEEYVQLIDRVQRCRNSLAHGGPINVDVASTVKAFANREAKVTTSIGLWAALSKADVKEAHTEQQDEQNKWRMKIATAPSVAAALVTPTEPVD